MITFDKTDRFFKHFFLDFGQQIFSKKISLRCLFRPVNFLKKYRCISIFFFENNCKNSPRSKFVNFGTFWHFRKKIWWIWTKISNHFCQNLTKTEVAEQHTLREKNICQPKILKKKIRNGTAHSKGTKFY